MSDTTDPTFTLTAV